MGNSMGPWWATVNGAAKRRMQLSEHCHAKQENIQTHYILKMMS